MRKLLSIGLLIFALYGSLFCKEENAQKKNREDLSGILVNTAKLLEKLDFSSAGNSGDIKFRNRIVRHLRRAAESSDIQEQKNLFTLMIKGLKEDNLISVTGEFLFIENTSADLIINFDQKQKKFHPVVIRTNIEQSGIYSDLFQTIKAAVGKGILKRNVKFFPHSMPVKISEVLFPENFNVNSIVLPPYYPENSIYPRIILMWNNIEKYFNERLKPLSQKIFRSEISSEIGPASLLRHLFFHHIGHFTAPVGKEAGEEKGGVKKTGLKNLLYPAEEVRADLNYLLLVQEMDGKKLIEDGMKEKVFWTFILQKAERLTAFIDEKTISPSAVILNVFISGGGVKVDIKDKKLILDFELLSRIVNTMEPRFEEFLKKGDSQGCKAFLINNNKIPESLAEVLEIKKN